MTNSCALSAINSYVMYATVADIEKWKTAVEILSVSGNTPQSEAYKEWITYRMKIMNESYRQKEKFGGIHGIDPM